VSRRPVTGEFVLDVEKISKSLARERQKNEERERRAKESVVLTVGKHEGCGGEIEYRSSFVLDVPRSEVRYGGDNPTREVARCSCTKCGAMFDPYFEPYREQVKKYRKRK
jgi:hypothetical protein